jgi:bcr-type benzoyl-CoA reductase subunit C
MMIAQKSNIKLNTLESFHEINATFPKTVQILEYKLSDKKIFGWLCTYIPEEIIHAAGALPVRITGYSEEIELEDGNAYLSVNNCSFSRSCLQLGLKGGYEFLDGVIAASTCDGARRLFDIWLYYVKTPFHHMITVPRKYTEAAHELYYQQILQFKQHFEEFVGTNIADDELIKSINLYNESRRLLKKLYELRKMEKPPITGAETMEVLDASFRMPKEIFNKHLSDLLDEVSKSDNAYDSRARVMVAGSVMANPEFLKCIEGQGALVVTDELCTSTRYWSDPVVLNKDEPPLKSLSRRYLNNFPCARMVPSNERFQRIIDLVRDFKVDGVISQVIRYCVPYAHDVPMLRERLKKIDVPMLALDVEYGTSGSGQIQTRVQAFLEMLEAKSK